MNDATTASGGTLYGPRVRPRNLTNNTPGSIHDDRTAQALGMRGGLVTGRVLLIAFAPLLLQAFGDRWFEHGTISIEFRTGVVDQEEVQAALQEPPAGSRDTQVQAWIERQPGEIVARGTASVGNCAEPTWLGAMDLQRWDLGEYRILEALPPGFAFPDVDTTLTVQHAQRMETGLPSLPMFTGASPWGGPVASPAVETTAMTAGCTAYRRERPILGVPVDGAIELRNINGPVFLERPYHVSSRVIARGHSPQTEYMVYESALEDPAGTRIAEMRMKLRFMKGSAQLLEAVRAAG